MHLGARRRGARACVTWLAVLAACAPAEGRTERSPADSLHVRVLATHDFHGALRAVPGPGGRAIGGAPALASVMDSLEVACSCPTFRLDGGDQMQGTLDSNLTFGASVVAALNHLGLDAAAIGNHELDWGIDTLMARQREADYAWLAANVYRVDDGSRPAWATPHAIVERDGTRIGVVGYATSSTPRTLRPDVTAPYRFRSGYAAIRDALEAVEREAPDFVVIVAHAGGDCTESGCSGEMVELARQLPAGTVDLIVGGHDHLAGEGVVNGVPIVRAGASGRGVGVIDLHRRRDGSRTFRMERVPVYGDGGGQEAMRTLLEPHLRAADALGRAPVTTLAERLTGSATGDRKLGTLIAEATRRSADADVGLHNPGGTRADLPAGLVTYADVHRVLPFDNAVVRLTLSGRELRRLVEQVGPRYYFSNLRVRFGTGDGRGRIASLRFTDDDADDDGEVRDDATYTLATNDYLADGGDGLRWLADLPREAAGRTILDAVVDYLRALPTPVRLPPP